MLANKYKYTKYIIEKRYRKMIKKIEKPNLNDDRTEKTIEEVLEFDTRGELIDFVKQIKIDEIIDHFDFEQCVFVGCNFAGTQFKNVIFSDIKFVGCDLSNAKFYNCAFHRTNFADCRLIGIDFNKNFLKNIEFEDCNSDYVFVTESKINLVRFFNCDMKKSAFKDCKQVDLRLEKCRLTEMEIVNTAMKGVDFTTCDLENIRFTGVEFKGAKVNYNQAVQLALILGIIVE